MILTVASRPETISVWWPWFTVSSRHVALPKCKNSERSVGFMTWVAAQIASPEVIAPDVIQGCRWSQVLKQKNKIGLIHLLIMGMNTNICKKKNCSTPCTKNTACMYIYMYYLSMHFKWKNNTGKWKKSTLLLTIASESSKTNSPS